MLYGGIEAGGTKFVCAVLQDNSEQSKEDNKKYDKRGSKEGTRPTIVQKFETPTTAPTQIVSEITAFFSQQKFDNIETIGIGSFGPIDMDISSSHYGFITSTPKAEWINYDLLGNIKKNLPFVKKFGFTTDVNAAAFAEQKLGAGRNTNSCIYFTVGTGIGAGIVIDGKIFNDKNHAEIGHMLIRRTKDDNYEGGCIYHKDCLEGLASGPTVEARTSKKGQYLEKSDPVWDVIANYLAQACINITLSFRPDKIIFGGGVLHQKHLFPKIRASFERLINRYVTYPEINDYIVSAALGDDAGVIGAGLVGKAMGR